MAETFRERRPAPALAGHVVCIWVQEVTGQSAPHRQRLVPNGSAEVLCVLGQPVRVRGAQTGPVTRETAAGSIVVGARLRPAATRAVLGVPGSALIDLEVDAALVWGCATDALEEALALAGPERAATLLERAVAARLRDAPDIDPIADEAARRLGSSRPPGVRDVAGELFVSERQLRRRVETATGLPPKPLQRVLRFQRFLALAAAADFPSRQIARLAADAGYADQAHLTREAVRLEGLAPAALLAEAEAHCACGHDHSASYAPLVAGA